MKSLGVFRVLGLGALAASVGATLLLTAPKAEAGTVVAIGVGPGYYAPYYPRYPYPYRYPRPYGYYPAYPAYYAPAPVYAPILPFVGSVSFFFGSHGYGHNVYGHGYHH